MNIFEDTENSKKYKIFCWNKPILNLILDNSRQNDTEFERKIRRFKWKYSKQKQKSNKKRKNIKYIDNKKK